MNEQKQQIVEKLNSANNVLVTVSANPSVDQLAACIGLTLLLNKMGKHATAVFSGQVPPAINFLKPQETIEKNTDSLRDFIIAIDKAKADKLRYKVEDEVVKIFITPYQHSIGEEDLIFSQGDFNVDVVMALGIARQQDVDTAITAHGRILHDAVVISISNTGASELGSINWVDTGASGVAELVSSLAGDLGKDLLDKQIATALLTGIVDETDHFGNQKTTPQTMTVSAALLAAGANQQLVSRELGQGAQQPATKPAPVRDAKSDDGRLKIAHQEPNFEGNRQKSDKKQGQGNKGSQRQSLKPETPGTKYNPSETIPQAPLADLTPITDARSDDSLDALLHQSDNELKLPSPADTTTPVPDLPPLEPTPTPMLDEAPAPILDDAPAAPPEESSAPVPTPPVDTHETLADLEKAVHSPHVQEAEIVADAPTDVDSARKAVEDALSGSAENANEPLQALNAMPVNLDLGHETAPADQFAPPPPIAPPSGLPGLSMPAADEPAFASSTPLAPPQSAGLPSYLTTPGMNVQPQVPTAPAQDLPPNPAANEPAPLNNSPADQPVTMPLPTPGTGMPPSPFGAPQPAPFGVPPQGPPPPNGPPPMMPPFPQR